MKRLIFMFLGCLLLAACTHEYIPSQNSEKQSGLSGSSTVIDGFKEGMIEPLYFVDIDSYNEFVEVADLPDNFVYYDDLSMFGEFDSLIILSQKVDNYLADDYSEYLYSFLDANGNELNLWVGSERIEKTPVVSKYRGDMRVISATEEKLTGSVFWNGIEYRYHGGNLSYISWESNGIPFTLGTDTKVEGFYPDDGPLTFVQELLHTDTNKAAMEKFEASLNAPEVK